MLGDINNNNNNTNDFSVKRGNIQRLTKIQNVSHKGEQVLT